MSKSTDTRANILNKAFNLIYVNGYQSTSIDEILAMTNVTKGAFYYHFNSKEQMGLAIINEIIFPEIDQSFILPLKDTDKPVKDIYKMVRTILFDVPFFKVENGCPLANLIQEMGPLNLDFGIALNGISNRCIKALKEALKQGKKAGKIRSDTHVDEISYFILSGYWGVRSLGKLHASKDCYAMYLEEFKRYLKSLQ